jgi:hypothetical protein
MDIAAQAEHAPTPLAPTERVAELLESLSAKEPELVDELIGAIAKCNASDVVAIFGGQRAPSASPAGGTGENPQIDDEPAAEPGNAPVLPPRRWSAHDRGRANAR